MLRCLVCTAIFILWPALSQAKKPEPSYIGEPLSILADKGQDIFDRLKQTNDSLYGALELAYQNNPALRAARAEFLAVQEQLPQAESGFKPTIVANADITHIDTDEKGNSPVNNDGANISKTAALNLEQPVFRGGSTLANIRTAQNVIKAQQFSLSAAEQGIIYEAAEAYMNVLRDKALLGLNENNRNLAMRQLEQARNRFHVGELTRTDVSQSEARLADAEANIITAEGNLRSARAVYRQIIGSPPPKKMAFPATILVLPKTLEEVLALAESNNRDILQAKFTNAAAESDVDSVFGELLPQILARGSLSKDYDPNRFTEAQRVASAGLNASVPLYQAGATRSRVREAKKKANQRYLQIIEAQNRVKQETLSNWEELKAAEAEIKARQSQMAAAEIAREGVHYEAEFGERTTLDALDANQELLDARVNLVIARRNEVVARFALARSLGILVPQKLGFSTVNP